MDSTLFSSVTVHPGPSPPSPPSPPPAYENLSVLLIPQDIEAMRVHAAEQLEKEEKRKASELAREKRALLYQAPRRRSGRLLVSTNSGEEGSLAADPRAIGARVSSEARAPRAACPRGVGLGRSGAQPPPVVGKRAGDTHSLSRNGMGVILVAREGHGRRGSCYRGSIALAYLVVPGVFELSGFACVCFLRGSGRGLRTTFAGTGDLSWVGGGGGCCPVRPTEHPSLRGRWMRSPLACSSLALVLSWAREEFCRCCCRVLSCVARR